MLFVFLFASHRTNKHQSTKKLKFFKCPFLQQRLKKRSNLPPSKTMFCLVIYFTFFFQGNFSVNIVIWFTVFQQAHLHVAVYRMKKSWSNIGILYLQVVTATFLLACFLSPKESTCKTRKIVFISLQKLFPFSRLSKFKISDVQF